MSHFTLISDPGHIDVRSRPVHHHPGRHVPAGHGAAPQHGGTGLRGSIPAGHCRAGNVPFLASGEIGAVGVIAALAVASTVVDVSPFSTNGALVLANAPEDVGKDKFYKQILAYSGIVVAVGPAIAWLVMVVPGWM